MIREVCVETLEEALLAEERRATRIELCSNLAEDGLTPCFDLIRAAKSSLEIPIRVMIRLRAGDFTCSSKEIEQMKQEIDFCKEMGVEGVVFGVLTRENELDIEKISKLCIHAAPLNVTIHKAIDLTPDPIDAIISLLKIPGITSVLTSGGALTAIEGVDKLKIMIDHAADDIEVIVAGKVKDDNLSILHELLNAKAYHGRRIVGELAR